MDKKELQCGIIMPIAPMGTYTSDHWSEVKEIIIESMTNSNEYIFKTDLVSETDGSVDIIHKRIVNNLHEADVVVCDVSGKNPNVLFELGMRLTFDKPTIIIKDDITDYMFDTSMIEHITYPSSLRFHDIVSFKKLLAKKVISTLKRKEREGDDFSQFLTNFGQFIVPSLKKTEVSENTFIINEISTLKDMVSSLTRVSNKKSVNSLLSMDEFSQTNFIRKEIMKYFSLFPEDLGEDPKVILDSSRFINIVMRDLQDLPNVTYDVMIAEVKNYLRNRENSMKNNK